MFSKDRPPIKEVNLYNLWKGLIMSLIRILEINTIWVISFNFQIQSHMIVYRMFGSIQELYQTFDSTKKIKIKKIHPIGTYLIIVNGYSDKKFKLKHDYINHSKKIGTSYG